MNIAILSTGKISNGKEATFITVNDYSKELARSNHRVTIIVEKREEKERIEKSGNLLVYRIGGIKYASLYNRILGHALGIKRMQNSLDIKYDLIHSFSAAPLFVLRGFASKIFARKAKQIHTLKSYSRSKWGRSFYSVLNLADAVTVPTNHFAEKLIQLGVKKRKIHVVHSNINLNKFRPQEKNKLKEKYGFKDKVIIFYYGAMWHMKGVDYLLEAIPSIIKERKNIKIVFAPRNDDKYVASYQKQIQQERYQGMIEILTNDLKIEDYVALADLVVLPYPNLIGTEGNPSCLLEAMACKTPVVTTDLPELKEIADGLVWMAKPGDARSLAETINYALEHPSAEMVEKAYLKAQEFSVEKITEEFLEVYRRLD